MFPISKILHDAGVQAIEPFALFWRRTADHAHLAEEIHFLRIEPATAPEALGCLELVRQGCVISWRGGGPPRSRRRGKPYRLQTARDNLTDIEAMAGKQLAKHANGIEGLAVVVAIDPRANGDEPLRF